MEQEILMTLGFKLLEVPSLYVFTEALMIKLCFHHSKNFQELKKILTYVTKMVMHDYQLIT